MSNIYEIEVASRKQIEIKVTVKELLEKTDVIIQGMSGSIIIQNGKNNSSINTYICIMSNKKLFAF